MLLSLTLAPACAPTGGPPPVPTPKPSGTKAPAASARPSTDPAPVAPLPTTVAPATAAGWRVLMPDGGPAGGAKIRVFLVSDLGGSLVSNNGGNVVSNNGGAYRLQAAPDQQTVADADGRFTLTLPAGSKANVEAAAGELKALVQNAGSDAAATLTLAPTGAVRGKVRASDPAVTDLEGIDVFVPGSDYVAKAAKDGSYALSALPAGTFEVVATRTGLGRGTLPGVVVRPGQTTDASELVLAVQQPTIATITPPAGGKGTRLRISGANFGASSGRPVTVSLGGALADDVKPLDDGTIEATIPPSARSGELVVTVDGVPSVGKPFTLYNSLGLFNEDAYNALAVGTRLALPLRVADDAGKSITDPAVVLAIEGTGAKLADGQVEGVAPGEFTLTATSGTLTARWGPLRVHAADAPLVASLGPSAFPVYGRVLGLAAGAPGTLQLSMVNLMPQPRVVELALPVRGSSFFSTYAGDWGLATGFGVAADGTIAFAAGNGIVTFKAPDLERRLLAGDVGAPAGTSVEQHLARPLFLPQPGSDGATGSDDGAGAAARFNGPTAVCAIPGGGYYVADTGNRRIRRITAQGQVTTVAGSGAAGAGDGPALEATFTAPTALALGSDGALYVVDGMALRVLRDGRLATIAATGMTLVAPTALTVAPGNRLLVADPGAHRVWLLPAAGGAAVPIGDGTAGLVDGSAAQARFTKPRAIATADDGYVYVGDDAGALRRIWLPPAP